MKSLKNSWSNEVGRVSKCDMTHGHNITDGEFYKFHDHLLDSKNEHWVQVTNDSGDLELVPLECFKLTIDDEKR